MTSPREFEQMYDGERDDHESERGESDHESGDESDGESGKRKCVRPRVCYPLIYKTEFIISSLKKYLKKSDKYRTQIRLPAVDRRIMPPGPLVVNDLMTEQVVRAHKLGLVTLFYRNGVFPLWFVNCNIDRAKSIKPITPEQEMFYNSSLIFINHVIHMLYQIYISLSLTHIDFDKSPLIETFYDFARIYAHENASLSQMLTAGRMYMPALFTDEWANSAWFTPCTIKKCIESCFISIDNCKGLRVVRRDHTGFNYSFSGASHSLVTEYYNRHMLEIMKIRDMRECTEQHKRNFVEFAIYSHMNEVDEVIKQAKKVTKRAVIEVDHTEVDGLGWGTLNASNFYVLS